MAPPRSSKCKYCTSEWTTSTVRGTPRFPGITRVFLSDEPRPALEAARHGHGRDRCDRIKYGQKAMAMGYQTTISLSKATGRQAQTYTKRLNDRLNAVA